MAVTGKVENWKKKGTLRLAHFMVEAKAGEEKVNVSRNVDNLAIFVQKGDYCVTYFVKDLVRDAMQEIDRLREREKHG